MGANNLDGDIGGGIPRTDDQDAAFLQLGRIAIFMRVELENIGIQLGGKTRRTGFLIVRHGCHLWVVDRESPESCEKTLSPQRTLRVRKVAK